MRKIYIVLSRSNTTMALMVRAVTRKYYSHAALALDPSLDDMYSFGRRNPHFMLPAGFVTDHRNKGFYKIHPEIPICVLEKEIEDYEFDEVKNRLSPFLAEPVKYKYDLKDAALMAFGRKYKLDDHYVCSVFVASMLRDVLTFDKDISLVTPEDFFTVGAEKIYEGKIKDYAYEEQ